jgi:hypothetical protein
VELIGNFFIKKLKNNFQSERVNFVWFAFTFQTECKLKKVQTFKLKFLLECLGLNMRSNRWLRNQLGGDYLSLLYFSQRWSDNWLNVVRLILLFRPSFF